MPHNPQAFVVANSNAVLRIVDSQTGKVSKKMKMESQVRALQFDHSGRWLFAGTKGGAIHVLECIHAHTLMLKFSVQIGCGMLSCIRFVPARCSKPARLLVNSSDSKLTILDCIYSTFSGALTNLVVQSRLPVANCLLPLKCCF